ncbi:sensor domain-containing diguanylate cyclase [uncultured Neptuniibacter sp.]|uniref:sensor domain-containing diguanylate cyclase n=1 Tax=uncultured Neptuniibacter sp. TaxID=502143 RepID=UPI002637B8E0|nr:sensor domain-containing diguanylate cyclase [uncultured Neptuniibacter sp.]
MGSSELERDNQELRRTLRLMVNKAESNEATLNHFFEVELRLLSCSRLSELLDLILIEFKRLFNLSNVNLILFDPEHAARSLLDDYIPPPNGNTLRFVQSQRLLNSLYPNHRLIVGSPSEQLRDEAFPITDNPIQSCALLPLIRHNCLIGSLHLGSNDISRYTEHVRYDYIQHLASVISVCIENCINQENLHRLSSIDMLTKVHNRRSFDQEIIKEISRASRTRDPLACLFLDLDHFKLVNDNFGHQTGDKVLRTVGLFLGKQLRKTDTVGRYGGEEFAILLPNCSEKQALEVAENLRQKLSKIIFRNEDSQPFRMTTSVGVSVYNSDNYTNTQLDKLSYQLLRAADKAVYMSKHNGRDQVSFAPCPKIKPDHIKEA